MWRQVIPSVSPAGRSPQEAIEEDHEGEGVPGNTLTNTAWYGPVKSKAAQDIHTLTATAHSVAIRNRKSNHPSRTVFGDGACVKRQFSASRPCMSPPTAHRVALGGNHVGGFGASGANSPWLTCYRFESPQSEFGL